MLSPPSSPGLGKVIVLPPTSPGGSAILCFFFILAHNSIERKKLKVAQSCPTLCNPMDNRVHGILQARILEWVTVPFSRGSSQPRDQSQVCHIAGGFFTSWATNAPQNSHIFSYKVTTKPSITSSSITLSKWPCLILFFVFYWEGLVSAFFAFLRWPCIIRLLKVVYIMACSHV